MTPGKDIELLREGIAAAQAGDSVRGYTLVERASRLAPDNEMAWLWLASLATDPALAKSALEKVLQLNPGHEKARVWLAKLDERVPRKESASENHSRPNGHNLGSVSRPATAANGSHDGSAALVCPFCSHHHSSKPIRCGHCLALLSVIDLDSFFAEIGQRDKMADSELLSSAIDRLEDTAVETRRAGDYWTLGLAHLNLRQYEMALAHFTAACDLRPEDEELRAPVVDLRRRIESLKSEIGNLGTKPVETEALEQELLEQDRRESGSSEHRINGDGNADISPVLNRKVEDTKTRRVRAGAKEDHAGTEPIATSKKSEEMTKVVLVVDDSPTVRKLVAMTLEKQSYRVMVAADGMEGLAKLQEAVPDLILLDINMPHLDGYKLSRVIKDNDLTRDVPVVMLSGNDGFFDKVRGRMAGAIDYITKPVEPSRLLRSVDKHFATTIAAG